MRSALMRISPCSRCAARMASLALIRMLNSASRNFSLFISTVRPAPLKSFSTSMRLSTVLPSRLSTVSTASWTFRTSFFSFSLREKSRMSLPRLMGAQGHVLDQQRALEVRMALADLLLEHGQVAQQAGHQVVELVGEAAEQLAEGAELLGVDQLFLELEFFADVLDLQDRGGRPGQGDLVEGEAQDLFASLLEDQRVIVVKAGVAAQQHLEVVLPERREGGQHLEQAACPSAGPEAAPAAFRPPGSWRSPRRSRCR